MKKTGNVVPSCPRCCYERMGETGWGYQCPICGFKILVEKGGKNHVEVDTKQ